jgi:hypothetical protein
MRTAAFRRAERPDVCSQLVDGEVRTRQHRRVERTCADRGNQAGDLPIQRVDLR